MFKTIKGLVIIGYSLSLLYLTTVLVYAYALTVVPDSIHVVLLLVFYGLLCVAALAVIQMRAWGLQTLLFGNILVGLYSLFLMAGNASLIQPAYLFMHLIVIVFFSQKQVRVYFQRDLQYSRKSILLIDDDEGQIKILKKILLPRGYSVLSAMTGEKGLQIAKLQQPDLILLDVILPGIKGRDVCARLKEDPEIRDIPVVFLTAKDSPDDIQAEKAAGAVAHLTKPVNPKALLAQIRKLLR